MKIKGKVKNLAPSLLINIMAVTALFTVPLRTYQLVNIIEPQTGFYARYDITILILYALIFVACLLFFLLSFIDGAMPAPNLPRGKNVFIGVSSAFLSITLLIDSIMQIDKLIALHNKYDLDFFELLYYLVKTGGMTALVQAIFAILSAVYFSIFAISYLKGKEYYKTERVMALFPIIWGLCRAIQRFIEPIRFKNVSELLLQLFMLIFMLVFFLSFARIASQVNGEKSMWLLFASGLSASLIAMTITVPSIIVMIMGKSSLLYSHYPVAFCDLFFAVFVVALLLELVPSKLEIEQMNKSEVELIEQTEEKIEGVQ
ncbi:MAG: hypothetical protein GX269_05190 [Clostridiales bacterium]|jgi:hypothetical protein|nr:hypothetical protein [Clostridiales bacterium]